jgi:DNA-binding response OmpR family regulator
MATVMLVDDEPEVHELLGPYRRREGYRLVHVADGRAVLGAVRDEDPDVVLLDLMLPGLDGFEACRRIREQSDCRIIMLSARSEATDKVLGLGLGADDYVTKPFSPAEVVARVKAQLRRLTPAEAPAPEGVPTVPPPPDLIVAGPLCLDPAQATVQVGDGPPVELSAQEFRLLAFLARSPGRIFTKRQIYERVWEQAYMGAADDNAVMVAVRRVREKIEPVPERPQYLTTVRGLGYRVRAGPS